MRSQKCASVGVLMVALSIPLWSQIYSARATGTVTKDGTPVGNGQIVFSTVDTGRQYKTKTGKGGDFVSMGMAFGTYKVQVIGHGGEVLYTRNGLVVDQQEIPALNIDLAKPEASNGVAGDPSSGKQPATQGKASKDQQKAEAARAKADNEKVASLNELIKKYQAAAQAENWPEAEKALQELVAAEPDTTRWEVYQRLADAQDRNNEQANALRSLDKGIDLAQAIVAGKAAKDPHNPNPDPAQAKAGIAQMLLAEGNIYVKLGSSDLAAPLFAQAAQDNPSSSIAYYNLCVVQFNAGKFDEAVAACDKSLAADPTRAEAWFLKGSSLYKSGKTATEALNKYLELDPNGKHVDEAKSMVKGAAK